MASIIPGFEYDIFISYRQNDNLSGWVTEFVSALQEELAATLKEPVSVYLDTNPNDGLLEIHSVDKSLEGKLKCLIFIPIISQTYCDSKSFAWQHEFVAYNKMAMEDQFGRDIRLSNGNVTSRILPVKIHDLDTEDMTLLENELGGVLRSIEFIYRASGVNRPLKPNDERAENLNHTYYRDQINKVANAVKEIINAIKKYKLQTGEISKKVVILKHETIRKLNPKFIIGSFLVLAILVLGYFFVPKLFKSSELVEKSIAVLPFENMSNDPEQEYFSDGMMQEIMNHLFKIGGLKIPSSTSSMRYKGSKLSVREIARELGVSYILEGNVFRSGDNIRIIVRLINCRDERLLWTEDYKRAITAVNLLEIQSDVAQQVALNMKVVINPDVRQRIETKPTVNTEAYTLFLKAFNPNLTFDQSKSMLERVIILDPGYADAYSTLANLWIYSGGHDAVVEREKVLEKAEPLLEKSLQLDKNSLDAHSAMASLRLYYFWDFKSVEKQYQLCKQLNPSNSDIRMPFSDYLLASGKSTEAFSLTKKAFDLNKNSADYWVQMSLAYYYNDQQEKALETIQTAEQLFPNDDFVFINSIRLLDYLGKYDKAIELFENKTEGIQLNDLIPYYLGHIGIAYFKTHNKSKSAIFLNELLSRSRKSPVGSPSFFASAVYTAMGEKDNALQSLEKAYSDHEVEMYWLKVEPLFRPLHGDPRFENILLKIGFK